MPAPVRLVSSGGGDWTGGWKCKNAKVSGERSLRIVSLPTQQIIRPPDWAPPEWFFSGWHSGGDDTSRTGRQERFTVVPCFEFEICYLYFIRPSGQVWFLWFWFLVLLDRISDFRLRICYLNFIRHGGQVWSLFFVIWFFTFPSDFAFIPGIFFFFSLIYNNF